MRYPIRYKNGGFTVFFRDAHMVGIEVFKPYVLLSHGLVRKQAGKNKKLWQDLQSKSNQINLKMSQLTKRVRVELIC